MLGQYTSIKEAKLAYSNFVNDNRYRFVRLMEILDCNQLISNDEWFRQHEKTQSQADR